MTSYPPKFDTLLSRKLLLQAQRGAQLWRLARDNAVYHVFFFDPNPRCKLRFETWGHGVAGISLVANGLRRSL